ncbi:MAG TPA: hypothetical protein VGR28_09025 [Candidatus Thermoplasmatota archaeon]|jgi:hypothetical protein|nr:hypothetical protein [Candidatus Thermoplasmatota archaeon]
MKTASIVALLLAPLVIAGTGAASHGNMIGLHACVNAHTITTVATGVEWPAQLDPSLPSGEIIIYVINYANGLTGPPGGLNDWIYIESGALAGLQEGRGEYITEEILGLGVDPANSQCWWATASERDLLVL